MDIIQYCIDIELNVNAYNIAGDSALIISAKKQNLDMVKKVKLVLNGSWLKLVLMV